MDESLIQQYQKQSIELLKRQNRTRCSISTLKFLIVKMNKGLLLAFLVFTLSINCDLYSLGKASHLPRDPELIQIDKIMRDAFYKTGELLAVTSRPCKVGVIYELAYQSGLRAEVELEKASGNLKILKYKYQVDDPRQLEEYSKLCKVQLGGYLRNQGRTFQDRTSTSYKSPVKAIIQKTRKTYRIATDLQLSDKEVSLCNQVSQLEDFPNNAQLLRSVRYDSDWIFDFVCDSDRNHIHQYQVSYDKNGKFILRNRKSVQKQAAISSSVASATKQAVENKVEKVIEKYIQTEKTVEKIIETRETKIDSSSLTIDSKLQYAVVDPSNKQLLPSIGKAVDALKFQLNQESETTQLVLVQYARKNPTTIVIKLNCKSAKRSFEFLFEIEEQVQAKAVQNVVVSRGTQQKVVEVGKKDYSKYQYQPVPTAVLELSDFNAILKRIIARNTQGQDCELQSIDWCKERRRFRVRAKRAQQANPFEFFGEFEGQDLQWILNDLDNKLASKEKINQVVIAKAIKEIQPATQKEQTVVVEKIFEQKKISKAESSKQVFYEKERSVKSKIQTRQEFNLIRLDQFEAVPAEVLAASTFEKLIVRILRDNKIGQCIVKHMLWKRKDNNVLQIVLIGKNGDEKYVYTEITDREGIFYENKNQKEEVRKEVKEVQKQQIYVILDTGKSTSNSLFRGAPTVPTVAIVSTVSTEVSAKKPIALIPQNPKIQPKVEQKCSFELKEFDINNIPFARREPQYLSFLTAQLQKDFLKSAPFTELLDFIAKERKLSNSRYSVVLMNKNKFGMRIVLENQADKKLSETLVEFLQKENKYYFQTIVWKELHSLHEITIDPFSEFYPAEKSAQLVDILTKAFTAGSALDNIASVESIQRKIAANGVYYRVIFNTKNSKQFQTEILFNPETNFTNVIEYQQVNLPYDYSLEQDYVIPYGKDFVEVEDFLLKRYKSVFNQAEIKFVKRSPCPDTDARKDNFRVVFHSHSGRYEMIFSYNYDNRETKVYRMQQLDQGFKLQGYSDIHTRVNQKIIERAREDYRKLFSNFQNEKQGNFEFKESFVEMDEHQNYGSYCRIGYNEPYPVMLTFFEDFRSKERPIYLSGIQSISTYPTNKYYSSQLFEGYSEITPYELKYNQAILTLQKKFHSTYSSILSKDHTVVAIFYKVVANKLVYRIVYKVQQKDIYIGSGEYNPVNQIYNIISLEKSTVLTIQGTYGDNCQKLSKDNNECLVCKTGFVKTGGRCYKKNDGCSAQIGTTCHFCDSGFVRSSDNKCYKNPEKVISIEKVQNVAETNPVISDNETEPTIEELTVIENNPIITVVDQVPVLTQQQVFGQGQKTQQKNMLRSQFSLETDSYQIQNDQYCLSWEGPICKVCTYRYYPADGICRKVPDPCSDYDKSTGVCTDCYTGYYLKGVNCLERDPLCAETNPKGQCVRCFTSYALVDGHCYYKASSSSLANPSIKSDPLCAQYNSSGKCGKCADGAYFNQKGKCTLADPFCDEFNTKFGYCERCMRGYESVQGKCLQQKRYR